MRVLGALYTARCASIRLLGLASGRLAAPGQSLAAGIACREARETSADDAARSPRCAGRCRPEVGVPSRPRAFAQSAVGRSPRFAGRCRPEAGVPSRPRASAQSAVGRSPRFAGRCRPEVGVPSRPRASAQSAVGRSPRFAGLCRPEVRRSRAWPRLCPTRGRGRRRRGRRAPARGSRGAGITR